MKNYRRLITTTLTIILIFTATCMLLFSQNTLLNRNGLQAFIRLTQSMIHPTMSKTLFIIGLKSLWVTISYALVAVTIASSLGFIIAVPASQIFSKKPKINNFWTTLLRMMRGIHELIWALFFVATIGLSPLTGILAIVIPYTGSLGKIFSDTLSNVQQASILQLRTNGANNMQLLFYGYLPQTAQSIKSYIFYRLECGIRSSAVLSFVGIGGIGHQIYISLQDLKYEEAWLFIYLLIIVVIFIDWLSKKSRQSSPTILKKFAQFAIYCLIILTWIHLLFIEQLSLTDLLDRNNIHYSLEFIKPLLGLKSNSAYLNTDIWIQLILLSLKTLQMSVIAIGFALFMALASLPFSRFKITQGIYIFTRTIPELIWAALLVFVFRPGILPGALALGLHNFGILGKLFDEILSDLNNQSILALSGIGANRLQQLFYGIIPTIYPRILSYTLYRFEIIIRSSIIVGIVGAGGLGAFFKLNMSFFKYDQVGMTLVVYLSLIFLVDYGSKKLQFWHQS